MRDQADVFGPAAFTPTAWRMVAGIAPAALAGLRSARTTAGDVACAPTAHCPSSPAQANEESSLSSVLGGRRRAHSATGAPAATRADATQRPAR